MNQIVNVVDRNPLFRLLQSDELDLLIAGNRQVLITDDVIRELELDVDDLLNTRLTDWLMANQESVIRADFGEFTIEDHSRFNPNVLAQNNPNSGALEFAFKNQTQQADISISRYISENLSPNISYEVISEDRGILSGLINVVIGTVTVVEGDIVGSVNGVVLQDSAEFLLGAAAATLINVYFIAKNRMFFRHGHKLQNHMQFWVSLR